MKSQNYSNFNTDYNVCYILASKITIQVKNLLEFYKTWFRIGFILFYLFRALQMCIYFPGGKHINTGKYSQQGNVLYANIVSYIVFSQRHHLKLIPLK